jgi:Protein of unknown function (DUF2934)
MATRSKKTTSAKAKTAAAKTRKSPKKVIKPSEDMIAERAWCIWKDNGCQSGQDEHNWSEAVSQLKTELVSR